MTSQTAGAVNGFRTAVIIMAIGLGAMASLATVLAFFGSLWWGFDLMANFRWQLMWSALIASVIYALTSRGIATIVFIIAVAVNAWLIAPLWLGSQPEATGEDGTRIVSVDIFGGSTDDEETLRWLFDSGAELIIASGATNTRLAPLVADGSPYRVLVAPVEPERSGIVILAVDDFAVRAQTTDRLAQQIYTVTIPTATGLVDVVTAWGELATDSVEADALADRLDAIQQIVETSPHETAVIGSLGATRFTAGMRSLLSATDLRDATEGSGYLSTWPVSDLPIVGGWIGIPLDVVLMSPGITPLELTTGPAIGVDHLPVTVVVGPSA